MSGQVARFLTEWRAGDPRAVERLVAVLYDELRALARRRLRRESSAHTLSATALVHEARALDLSTRSVQRSWTTARAWLRKELGGHAAATS